NLEREYDQEKWKSLLDKALALKKELTLDKVEEIYFGDLATLCCDRGKFIPLKLINAQKKYRSLIGNFFNQNIKNYSAIAELGCGYGSIIIDLAKRKEFRDKKFLA